jgi:glycosyltransferase involved in cell wall biosynthesis
MTTSLTTRTLGRNGNGTTHDKRSDQPLTGAPWTEPQLRLALPLLPTVNGDAPHPDERPTLAAFCYEAPDSIVGQCLAQTLTTLARRPVPIHLFARHAFELTAPGIQVHAIGDCEGEDLPAQVEDFTKRACNAFLRQFVNGSAHVTLMGCEWSSVEVLSILRGIKNVGTILSLHSLERQRSDMTSAVSKHIEEMELAGLREARSVLVHEPAVIEVARYWAPECADRMVQARPRFPVQQFESNLDPGAIKARYQVGPVDPTILYVGDLSERYGPDVLMKAMPTILRNNKQARLIVVGDGTLYWPLRVYARYLLLEHAVRLVGDVQGQALYELVQAADVIAVPSREPTPWWPILAGWAARRPVAATHQAAPGLVQHEQDSVLFYPSENSCVWGIERLLFVPELGRAIAEKGRHKLEERFGWNGVADQVAEMMGVTAARGLAPESAR